MALKNSIMKHELIVNMCTVTWMASISNDANILQLLL